MLGLLRALRIWRAVLTLLLLLWWDGQSWTYRGGVTVERRARRQQERARWLTAELLSLGSAFIKLGQLLSARPDILPAGWVAELAALQDSAPDPERSQQSEHQGRASIAWLRSATVARRRSITA